MLCRRRPPSYRKGAASPSRCPRLPPIDASPRPRTQPPQPPCGYGIRAQTRVAPSLGPGLCPASTAPLASTPEPPRALHNAPVPPLQPEPSPAPSGRGPQARARCAPLTRDCHPEGDRHNVRFQCPHPSRVPADDSSRRAGRDQRVRRQGQPGDEDPARAHRSPRPTAGRPRPLGEVEWDDTLAHIESTIPPGVPLILAAVTSGKTLLEQVEERGMSPSKSARWCTSDTKRGPIERELRRYLKANPHFGGRLVNCLGIRRDESAARAKRDPWRRNERLTAARRRVADGERRVRHRVVAIEHRHPNRPCKAGPRPVPPSLCAPRLLARPVAWRSRTRHA